MAHPVQFASVAATFARAAQGRVLRCFIHCISIQTSFDVLSGNGDDHRIFRSPFWNFLFPAIAIQLSSSAIGRERIRIDDHDQKRSFSAPNSLQLGIIYKSPEGAGAVGNLTPQ